MSIFGAMFSGVSGLNAQSQALGVIADNISNVNTIGYKATKSTFSTLVTRNATANSFSPGGVRANPLQEVSVQGLLQGSSSQTDIAIVGNGFFVVNASSTAGASNKFLFTRAGSFNPDKDGFLKNTAGLFLEGWPTDANGVPTVPNTSTLTSLTAINVAGISGSATPTTTISIGANLPATSNIGDTQQITAQTFDSLGIAHNNRFTFTKTAQNQWDVTTVPPDGSQIAVLNDVNGLPYKASGRLDFDRVPSDGESFSITDATKGALTFEFDTNNSVTTGNIRVNLTGLATSAQVAAAVQAAYADYTGAYSGTTVTDNHTTANITAWTDPTMTASTTGISAAANTVLAALLTGGNLQIPLEAGTNIVRFNAVNGLKYGSNGGAPLANNTDSVDLATLGGAKTIEIYVADGAKDVLIAQLTFTTLPTADGDPIALDGNLQIGPFVRTTGDTRMTVGTGTETSTLIFQQGGNSDAALTVNLTNITVDGAQSPPSAITQAQAASKTYVIPQTTSPVAPGIVFNSNGTPASFNVASLDVTYSNGAAASTAISMNFGTVGQGDAMTQFASTFTTYFINQNGVQFGTFSGVTISEAGLVTALFDNGQSSPIYKIPVVTFANPNGLFAKTGNSYAESDTSGPGLINTAGTGAAGAIAPGALEASTVDIADEFTDMIITQQAYSAAARIITTADEMLDEVLRIAR